jgi:26S proteasome regulatory subunit N7
MTEKEVGRGGSDGATSSDGSFFFPVPQSNLPMNPDLSLLGLKFRCQLGPEVQAESDRAAARAEFVARCEKEELGPFYVRTADEQGWAKDAALVARLEATNKKRVEELTARIADAEANQGEIEVREAVLAKASYLCRIGDKEAALTAFRVAGEKTVSLSQRLDISFTLIRMGFFFDDHDLTAKSIDKARFQLEEGGDWDRKNRLKVYEGIHLMRSRNFKAASALFLDSLATFTAMELVSFEEFALLTCITGMLALDRVTLKTKLMESPEVLSVAKLIPREVTEAMSALYNCNYDTFFSDLAVVTEHLKRNHWLARHQAYFCREMRIRAYAQLLESYKSVQIKSMAKNFGVTVEFLDRELSRFIFSGRLNAKIDKVSGVVETQRAEPKTALFAETIREGDALLNRVQRLSRVVNL